MRARSACSPAPRRGRALRPLAAAVAVLLAAWAAPAVAQAAYQPEFSVDLATARGDAPGLTRLDVYTAVPYTSLRFLARTGGFAADYAVTVDVYHLDDQGRQQGLAVSRTFERELTVPTYDATVNPDTQDRAVQTLAVEPGRYAVQVSVEDGASGRTFTREIGHVARPLDGAVALSDPVFLNRFDPDNGDAVPNVGAAVSMDQKEAAVTYEVYADAPTALRVTYVVTEQSRTRERPSFGTLLGLAPSQQADLGTPVVVTEPLDAPAGRTPAMFRFSTEKLQVGDYVLSIRLESPEGEVLAEAEKPFAVRWLGLDQQIANLDEAIAQLRYVAKDRDIQAIRAASTPEEKLRLFREFWSRRDPTPGSARNERMEEYYYRVAYANERYGRVRDAGWNTDRGEVFIRFGEPDFVEEHPFNYGTQPYQIWFYYQTGRRFIFVDQNGMGDFRLLVPIWDERTRM